MFDKVKQTQTDKQTKVIPQLYRTSYSTFSSDLSYELSVVSSAIKNKYIAGIRLDGTGSSTSWSAVNMTLLLSCLIFFCFCVLFLFIVALFFFGLCFVVQVIFDTRTQNRTATTHTKQLKQQKKTHVTFFFF